MESLEIVDEHILTEPYAYANGFAISKDKKSYWILAGTINANPQDDRISMLKVDVDSYDIEKEVVTNAQKESVNPLVNPKNGFVYSLFNRQFDVDTVSSGAGIGVNIATPSAPRNIKFTFSAKRASVTWSAPANNGGYPVTKYLVCFSSCNKAASWKQHTQRALEIQGLAKGSKRTIEIQAVNALGKGQIAKVDFVQTK